MSDYVAADDRLVHLDEQNARMGNRALIDVDTLLNPLSLEPDKGPRQIKLLAWARHAVTQASSCGVYGNTPLP